MNKLIKDPSCWNCTKNPVKATHVSMPHKYTEGVFKFFVALNGRVKEFSFKSLKTAAHARKFIASLYSQKGYQVCSY